MRKFHFPIFATLCVALLVGQTLYLFSRLVPASIVSADYLTRPGESHLVRRWQADDYYKRVVFIRDNTPPDSLIALPQAKAGTGAIGNRGLTDFFVFPRRTAHIDSPMPEQYRGPVFGLSVDGSLTTPLPPPNLVMDASFAIVPLRERLAVIALPAVDLVSAEPSLGNVALVVIQLGLTVLAGASICLRWFQLQTFPGFLAASFLTGLTVWMLFYLVLGFLGVPASTWLGVLVLACLSLPAVITCLRQPPRIPRPRDLALVVATVAAILLLAMIFLTGIAKPIVEWDAAAIWGIKARVISAFESLRRLGEWGAYPEYPPLVPVAMAELGVGGERFAKALFPLFTLCLYGVLFEGLVRAAMPRWLRVLAPFAVLLTPQILEHTQSGYANLALAVYLTLAVILWARWLYDGDARLGIATAVTLTGVVWVRPDGEVYAAYLILIAVGWQLLKRRSLRALAPLGLPVMLDLAWKVYYALNLRAPSSPLLGVAPQGRQMVKLMLTSFPTTENLLQVAAYLVNYMLGPTYWGLVPLAAVLVFLRTPRQIVRRYPLECAFLGASAGGLIILAVYLAPAWGISYFFNATFLRLYMAIVPLLYLITVRELADAFAVPRTTQSASGAVTA